MLLLYYLLCMLKQRYLFFMVRLSLQHSANSLRFFTIRSTILNNFSIPPIWTDDRVNRLEKIADKTQHKNARVTAQEGIATGRLIGGNMNTMCGFIGPPTSLPPKWVTYYFWKTRRKQSKWLRKTSLC